MGRFAGQVTAEIVADSREVTEDIGYEVVQAKDTGQYYVILKP